MTTVVACPQCQQNLLVPPEQLGQQVRCPGCAHVFAASDAASSTAVQSAAPPTAPLTAPLTAPPTVPPPLPGDDIPVHDVVVEQNVPAWERPPEEELAKPLDEDETADLDEAERRRRRKEDKKARKKDSGETGYYGELKRRQRKLQTEHRGVLVLVYGIVSILFSPCGLFAIGGAAFGYYAYQMGSHDLQEILSGRMDRSGESLVKAGRIMGLIGILLSAPTILISMVLLILFFVRVVAGAVTGN